MTRPFQVQTPLVELFFLEVVDDIMQQHHSTLDHLRAHLRASSVT